MHKLCILNIKASGVRKEVYGGEYSGWWHKYNSGAWRNKHTHSISWTVADNFVRYMGVVLTRTNHRDFSSNVLEEVSIAADSGNDGDWDNMAFVTVPVIMWAAADTMIIRRLSIPVTIIYGRASSIIIGNI